MLSDNHSHTKFSGDAEAEPMDMIRSAMEKGLSGLTFTDHLDWDYAFEPHLFDLDLTRYVPEMETLREKVTTDAFSLRIGIELGLQPHLADRHTALLSEYSFDYVIGSVHQVGGEDPYYDSFFEGKTFFEAYRQFLNETLANLQAFSDIDALGHLDYISRYGLRVANEKGLDGALRYEDHRDAVCAILSFLIDHDIALEVNTGAYGYGYDEPNPSFAILKRYYDMGGRMLTLGADAHRPERIAIAFDTVLPRLREIGFSSYYEFKKRIPREIPF